MSRVNAPTLARRDSPDRGNRRCLWTRDRIVSQRGDLAGPASRIVGQAGVALPRLRHADRSARQHSGCLVAPVARQVSELRRADLDPLSVRRAPHGRALRGRRRALRRFVGAAGVPATHSSTDCDLRDRSRVLHHPEPHRVSGGHRGDDSVVCRGCHRGRLVVVRFRRCWVRPAAFTFFFILHLVAPGGMGFGDVRLSFVLGLFLGWLGGIYVFGGLFLGFFLGAVIGIVLIAVGQSRPQAAHSVRSIPRRGHDDLRAFRRPDRRLVAQLWVTERVRPTPPSSRGCERLSGSSLQPGAGIDDCCL